MSHRTIYFALWNAGLCNQLMSLENSVGLSYLLKRPVVVTKQRARAGVACSYVPATRVHRGALCEKYAPEIQDVLDWSRKPLHQFIGEELSPIRNRNTQQISLKNSFVYGGGPVTTDRQLFADGRTEIIIDPSTDIVCINTLSWYSRFFYSRSSDLERVLESVAFKEPYQLLAKKIASSLGSFVGAHLRFTDLSRNIYALEYSDIHEGLAALPVNRLPLVISSDDMDHAFVRSLKIPFHAIDDLILGDFRAEFENLPFHDHTALAIISNLVLGYSDDFIGTPGSTFTGLVHRQLNQRGVCKWRFFSAPFGSLISQGNFSWANSSCPSKVRNWWREWSESKLQQVDEWALQKPK
jgi:hypothetical protein